jgi:membrane peptidoglycan carboxypeptidase
VRFFNVVRELGYEDVIREQIRVTNPNLQSYVISGKTDDAFKKIVMESGGLMGGNRQRDEKGYKIYTQVDVPEMQGAAKQVMIKYGHMSP